MHQLLLLHGAIGSAAMFAGLEDVLKEEFEIHVLDFSGHGGTPFQAEFSIQQFANEVLAYLDNKNIGQIDIFGYSMGGYVAMYLAKHHPERISKVATLATKYHWDDATSAKEVQMLDPEKISAKIPAFAKTLEERHKPGDWKELLQRTAAMMLAMGKDNPLTPGDYEAINAPALIMLGDKDKMVSLDETLAVYKSLPQAQLALLPGTPHPLEQVDVHLAGYFLRRFFKP